MSLVSFDRCAGPSLAGPVVGDWDLRGRFDEYIREIDLHGKTVLDVGTASGFLTFEAERRGATVTSFDADSPQRYQMIPPATPDTTYFQAMRNGYQLAHNQYNSKAANLW
jgi:hypothetical protein